MVYIRGEFRSVKMDYSWVALVHESESTPYEIVFCEGLTSEREPFELDEALNLLSRTCSVGCWQVFDESGEFITTVEVTKKMSRNRVETRRRELAV